MSSSKLHVHEFEGCRPTPLAHYLKALGILRLVAEQKDPKARGWWRGDRFVLATILDRKPLEEFFLHEYSPTPMVAPWNGGSGFYPKDNKSGVEPIEQSTAARFGPFRETIAIGKQVVGQLNQKPEKGSEKNGIIAACRKAWRAGAQEWIDAAIVLSSDGECSYPAMLGTGGNDGRLDFTSNYMQRIVSLFDTSDVEGKPHTETIAQIRVALWNDPTPTLEAVKIGQFFPGAAGGPNGSDGFAGSVRVNPWDYVLMLEGAILFRSGLSRRCADQELPQASAPFAVRGSGAGYGSSDSADAGPRGEQWMPIWGRGAMLAEVISVFREGRSRIDGKAAKRGIDMTRSIARTGVARGINEFERYGYIERNGLANLAVPLGRFVVEPKPNQELLTEVMPWLDQLRRISSDKNAPVSFDRLNRACEEAVFNSTRKADGESFLNLLIAMAQAEDQFVQSPRFAAENFARPIPSVGRHWLDVISGGTDGTEFRLARSLTFQRGRLSSKGESKTIRCHWLPLDGSNFSKRESGLSIGPDQCAIGHDLQRACVAVMQRRLIALSRGSEENIVPLHLPFDSLGASLTDLEAFLQYRVDDGRVLAIARGLMAIDVRQSESNIKSETQKDPLGGMATYGVLRLALPTGRVWVPGKSDIDIRCNATTFHRLRSGDLVGAINIACQRLSVAGLRPRIKLAVGSVRYAQRLAAAMAFGVSRSTLTRLTLGLTQPEMSHHEQHEMNSIAD